MSENLQAWMRTERILVLFHPEISISIVTFPHKIFALLQLFRNFLWPGNTEIY